MIGFHHYVKDVPGHRSMNCFRYILFISKRYWRFRVWSSFSAFSLFRRNQRMKTNNVCSAHTYTLVLFSNSDFRFRFFHCLCCVCCHVCFYFVYWHLIENLIQSVENWVLIWVAVCVCVACLLICMNLFLHLVNCYSSRWW